MGHTAETIVRIYGYLLAGIPLIVINFFLFCLIILKKSQRDSYLVLAFVFLNNGLTGLVTFLTGLKRLFQDNWETVSQHECFIWPIMPLIPALRIVNSFSLLINSIDRLLAVSFPLKYFRDDTKYAVYLILAHYAAALALYSYLLVATFTEKTRYILRFCATYALFEKRSFIVILGVTTTTSIASIFIMLVVVRQLKKRGAQVAANRTVGQNNSQEYRRFLKRQRSYNITSVISCVITLFLYVIPTIAEFVSMTDWPFEAEDDNIGAVATYFCLLNAFNLSGIFIYRQQDIRAMAVQYLCCIKHLMSSQTFHATTVTPTPETPNTVTRRTPRLTKTFSYSTRNTNSVNQSASRQRLPMSPVETTEKPLYRL